MAKDKGRHARRRDQAERFRMRGDRLAAIADGRTEREPDASLSENVGDGEPGTKSERIERESRTTE